MEAVIFGFLAYFGSEIAEFTHEQYDEHLRCRIEVCEEQESQTPPTGTISIKSQHSGDVVAETQLGEGNE